MKVYPGPVPWLEKAAEKIDHRPGDVDRAKNLDGFSTFSDLVGQAMLQKDGAVARDQLKAAEASLAPLRLAVAASKEILGAARESVVMGELKVKVKAAP